MGLADVARGIIIDGGDFNGLLPSLDDEGREGGIMVLARRFAEIMDERKMERERQIRRDAYQVWESWNYRRLLAKEQGEEFNEPPPTLDDLRGER